MSDQTLATGAPLTAETFADFAERLRYHCRGEGVRVEQLQSISEADAMAEGIERYEGALRWVKYFDVLTGEAKHITARDAYAALIDAINRPGTWASNPWVWVIDYKIIEVRR